MKLNIKRSVGKLEQFNIRIPAPLKKRLDATRKRAEGLGVDFIGTLTVTLDQFDVALTEQLNDELRPTSANATDSVARTLRSNGADADRT
jgi:hypothetical protein